MFGLVWLYHYNSQIGSAAMIFATAYIVWHTAALPRSTCALAVLGILPLVHTWVGLPAAYSTAAWIGLTGVALLVLPATEPQPERIVS